MMVPIASIVLIWQVLFHYNGMVNDITALFGAGKIDWLKSDHAQVVIIVLFLWKKPSAGMPCHVLFRQIPDSPIRSFSSFHIPPEMIFRQE